MSEHNLQMCRFCQRSVKLTYYCESCGASCCSDCLNEEKFDYYVCQDCESKNITNQNSKRSCKDCSSENVIKITQHLKSCPKCHSHQIINIYEKREELEQKFLELIKETRAFVKPFRDIINKLYILRQKIKQARDPPIKCFHYPRMESELLALFKAMNYVKNNLLEKIGIHFQHLSINKEYFFDIHTQPNSNIRIIEGILENLYRSVDSINEFTNKNLEKINEGAEKLQDNLKFIERINEIYLTYKRFLNLADKEKPVYAVKCKLQNGLNSQDTFKKNKGILFITNFDLSFIHEFGVIKKKQEKIFKAPVRDLTKIFEKGTIFKKLYIEFPYGKYEFSLPTESIQRVIDYILLARTFDETVIFDEVSARRLFEIDLDLNDVINFIEEGIISFFNIKCQYNKHSIHSYRDEYIPNSYPQYDTQPQWQQRSSQPPPQNTQANYNQGNYHPQDRFRVNRFQNYSPNPHYQNQEYSGFGDNLTPDEKLILMKQLERAQKIGGPSAYQEKPINRGGPSREIRERGQIRSSFHNMNNKHLSGLFNQNENNPGTTYGNNQGIYEYTDTKIEKLAELKREQYSLKETLKKLETKFDQGIISEVDYFRTFKNLQKEMYLIEKKIGSLSQNLQERDIFRRDFENKNFYL